MSFKSILSIITILLLAGNVLAATLEEHQLLKISDSEQKAVMKTPEGELVLIGVGDRVGEAQVMAIAQGRMVLERPGQFGPEKLIMRLENGRQKIDRMERKPLRRSKLTGEGELMRMDNETKN